MKKLKYPEIGGEERIINRLNAFIEYKKINYYQVVKQSGIANGLLNNARNGVTKDISHSTANKIADQYPELNRDWLLFGQGKMIIETPREVVMAMDNEELRKSLLELIETNRELVRINGELHSHNMALMSLLLPSLESSKTK